jgi:hypothetical protein
VGEGETPARVEKKEEKKRETQKNRHRHRDSMAVRAMDAGANGTITRQDRAQP